MSPPVEALPMHDIIRSHFLDDVHVPMPAEEYLLECFEHDEPTQHAHGAVVLECWTVCLLEVPGQSSAHHRSYYHVDMLLSPSARLCLSRRIMRKFCSLARGSFKLCNLLRTTCRGVFQAFKLSLKAWRTPMSLFFNHLNFGNWNHRA